MIRPGSDVRWIISVEVDDGATVRAWRGKGPIRKFRDDAVEVATMLLHGGDMTVNANIAWLGKRGKCAVFLYQASLADFDDAIYSVM